MIYIIENKQTRLPVVATRDKNKAFSEYDKIPIHQKSNYRFIEVKGDFPIYLVQTKTSNKYMLREEAETVKQGLIYRIPRELLFNDKGVEKVERQEEQQNNGRWFIRLIK